MNQTDFTLDQYPWKADIDYRLHPEQYRVGKGEQGVLICEPYKSEVLPHWRFKTPELAQQSSDTIYKLFCQYLHDNDFVGADIARKFLQMGFTRARRYTNYKGGKKYNPSTGKKLKVGTGDPLKAKSAHIFYQKWKQAESDPHYKEMKESWQKSRG
jgi:hypothetical protein